MVLEVSIFKSAKTLKKMYKDSFDAEGAMIVKAIPPMIDQESAKSISTSTDAGGSILNFVSSSNFLISFLLGSSMQQLWGMIRALQMIVLCQLVRVPTPSQAFVFF